jgi:magnesium transporter
MSIAERTNFTTVVTDLGDLKEALNELPPVDTGDEIAELPQEKRAIAFRLLNKEKAIKVFEYLPHEIQEELLGALFDQQVRQLVDSMSPDDRAFLFDELPAKVVQRLLQQLSPSERAATATILGYPEGTAGRIMTTEYVRLKEGLTVEEAVNKIRLQDRDKETIYYAYVTDENRRLVSVVSLRQLLFSIPTALIRDIASERVLKVQTETPQEEVAQVMKRYDLIALPVVDREDRLVGIVTIDDILDIVEEEATEDFQRLAGGAGDEQALCSPVITLRKRLPWLLANIGLYIGAASVIAPFQDTISLIPVLAVIMPILSNSSGNVAIQALTVTVRGLGVGEVTPNDTVRLVRKELLAGFGIALALGLALAVLSVLWSEREQSWIAIVAAIVMGINVLIAGTMGTVLPMVLKTLRLDPALISGPLLTTVLDVIGFLSFLVLVTLAQGIFNPAVAP